MAYRKQRVTLEIKYDSSKWSDPSQWIGWEDPSELFKRDGVYYRVVDSEIPITITTFSIGQKVIVTKGSRANREGFVLHQNGDILQVGLIAQHGYDATIVEFDVDYLMEYKD